MAKLDTENERNIILWRDYQQAKGSYLGLTDDHAPDTHDIFLKNYAKTMTLCANARLLSIEEFEENMEHLEHPAQVIIAYQVAIDTSPEANDKMLYAWKCMGTLGDFCGHSRLRSDAVELLRETAKKFVNQQLVTVQDAAMYLKATKDFNTPKNFPPETDPLAPKQKTSSKAICLGALGTRCKNFFAGFWRALDRHAQIDADSFKR